MYIKSLRILNNHGEVRNIAFHAGLNLIVDNTSPENQTETGNSVGKTTVLRLVDFCLGKDGKAIYTDPSDPKSVHEEVRKFVMDTKVIVELTLTRDWVHDDVVICRDFARNKDAIRTINGTQYKKEDFDAALGEHLLGINIQKPTFRQIISHNIRYTEVALNNVLKTLNAYTSDAEYESLYLFMFGCQIDETDRRQQFMEKLKTERAFKNRLERKNNKSTYRTLLALAEAKIESLNEKKSRLNIDPNFEKHLTHLNDVKCEINALSAEIEILKLKENTIRKSQEEIESNRSNIDGEQLATLYNQAKALIPSIQKTFEDLLLYHNKMVERRSQFVAKTLPSLTASIAEKEKMLKILLSEENELVSLVTQSDTYESLEIIISEMNLEYQKKGEYESQIKQIEEVESSILEAEKEIKKIDADLFSDEFRERVQKNIDSFNLNFTTISKQLYDEEYVIKVDTVNYKGTGRNIYKFSAFNANLSSGKKMGEISCFDIAYTVFAKEHDIPCLEFLLTDKKELMSDNQLLGIAKIVEKEGIQFVASILKDKLPEGLKASKYYIVELCEQDKLFRI